MKPTKYPRFMLKKVTGASPMWVRLISKTPELPWKVFKVYGPDMPVEHVFSAREHQVALVHIRYMLNRPADYLSGWPVQYQEFR